MRIVRKRVRRAGWVAAAVVVAAACAREAPPSAPTPEPDTARVAGELLEGVVEPERPVVEGPEAAPPEPDLAEAAAPEPDRLARERGRVEPSTPVLPGAVLPGERIVAFYGNPASRTMGILGELPPDQMLARLDGEVAKWRRADPATPVRPALHMIAVMATGDPGPDSLFRMRMPRHRIQDVVQWAARRDALVFLDIQPGHSSVRDELPRLRRWLVEPHIHLALDPEWTMPDGVRPGSRIGSMSADAINFAIRFLADLVEQHDLPPKVLVVHRFTQSMVRNADQIRLDPRVQVVINMDGWGEPVHKQFAYRTVVTPQPIQFTGFKLFFKNDRLGGSRLMTPDEILQLDPPPIYIQYQ